MKGRLLNVLDIIAVFLIDAVALTWLADRYPSGWLLLVFAFFGAAILAGWYARTFTLRRRST